MKRVALLIAASEYEPWLTPLSAAIKDVDAIREVLLSPEMGEFNESDVTILKNPDRQQMEMAIESLFWGRHKDDLVVLFFSGHGIKDDTGKLYFATRNTRKTANGELIRAKAVAAGFVHESMSRSRSKRQVIILDSCFSGAFADGMSAKDDGSVHIREQLGGEGRAVLTSSSSTQYSFEEEGEELSLYTRFLSQGIKTGEADADKDDFISINELHEYASRKVQELRPELKPEIYATREGFSIHLAKTPIGDPHQRYRKEVDRFIKRGEISIVGRGILDVLRVRLSIEAAEARRIEDEALAPHRQAFREKLQQYKLVFYQLLQQHNDISRLDRNELKALQQTLDLRDEDIISLESQILADLKTYKQTFTTAVPPEEIEKHLNKLQQYRQVFSGLARYEYPVSKETREELLRLKLILQLSDEDIKEIEEQVVVDQKEQEKNSKRESQDLPILTPPISIKNYPAIIALLVLLVVVIVLVRMPRQPPPSSADQAKLLVPYANENHTMPASDASAETANLLSPATQSTPSKQPIAVTAEDANPINAVGQAANPPEPPTLEESPSRLTTTTAIEQSVSLESSAPAAADRDEALSSAIIPPKKTAPEAALNQTEKPQKSDQSVKTQKRKEAAPIKPKTTSVKAISKPPQPHVKRSVSSQKSTGWRILD